MTDTFDRAFAIVVGQEGGYTASRADPGNWTGGKVDVGTLRGTKYGIAASAHPTLDIANLTLEQAKAIYASDYWAKVRGDELPPPLALLTFDAAVNSGPGQAIKWLQAALGVAVDGQIGPQTLAGAASASLAKLLPQYQAQRLLFLAGLPTWATFGRGWALRCCTLLLGAVAFEQPAAPAEPPITLAAIETTFRKVLTEKAVA